MSALKKIKIYKLLLSTALFTPVVLANTPGPGVTADSLRWSGTVPKVSVSGSYEIQSANGYPSLTNGVLNIKATAAPGEYEVEGSTELAFNVIDTNDQSVQNNFDIRLNLLQNLHNGQITSAGPELKLVRTTDNTEITSTATNHSGEQVNLRIEPGVNKTFNAQPGDSLSVRAFIEISNVN
ncbi:hypothetical protein ACQKQC_24945 [Vibrio fortis]|uniref:hypothetical protein n=1 Tax=Vibrio fortis TaxID=212667 RepID=UPI00406878DC